MEIWRVANFQSVQYENKTYYRIEYTDELNYVTWWEGSDDQMIKIKNKELSSKLENIFSLKYRELIFDIEKVLTK